MNGSAWFTANRTHVDPSCRPATVVEARVADSMRRIRKGGNGSPIFLTQHHNLMPYVYYYLNLIITITRRTPVTSEELRVPLL
jgi:hypothetical protein